MFESQTISEFVTTPDMSHFQEPSGHCSRVTVWERMAVLLRHLVAVPVYEITETRCRCRRQFGVLSALVAAAEHVSGRSCAKFQSRQMIWEKATALSNHVGFRVNPKPDAFPTILNPKHS